MAALTCDPRIAPRDDVHLFRYATVAGWLVSCSRRLF